MFYVMGYELNTLKSYMDGGYGLIAYCEVDHSCRHSARLDIGVLIRLLSADFPVVDRHSELLGRLVCSKCGRRGAALRVVAPNGFNRKE